MPRPRRQTPFTQRMIGAYVECDEIDRLDVVVAALGMTRADAVRLALSDLVEKHADRAGLNLQEELIPDAG